MTDLVLLATCRNDEEAEIVAATLRTEGIDSLVQLSRYAGGSGAPALGTVFEGPVASGGAGAHDVLVRAADMDRAVELLTAPSVDQDELEREAMAFPPPDDA